MTREEREKNRHEYTLMEMRLMCEDIKSDNRNLIKEFCEEKIEPIQQRISSLEASRDHANGVIKAVGVSVPAMGSLAWFMVQAWKSIKGN